MTEQEYLIEQIEKKFSSDSVKLVDAHHELTLICDKAIVLSLMQQLRDAKPFCFDQLIDVCAVDYLHYGQYDWETEETSESGFSRAVNRGSECTGEQMPSRFAVVYHLLSTEKNHRLRVKVFLDEKALSLPSVHEIWKSANWFEREAYDLYGILFENHPDLRRILTDYGFIGHPFRKDFPLSGQVEMRYDAKLQKVIYEPVDIEPRILVPKVIRKDNRYLNEQEGGK